MRLIATTRASTGATLGRDVLLGRPDGTPLLRAGVTLTAPFRDALVKAGVMAIYVEDELSAGITIDSPVDDRTRAVATQAVATMQDIATRSIERGDPFSSDPAIDAAVDSLHDITVRILAQIESCGGIALALDDLCAADGYTFQHSIDVAAIGLIVGRQQLRKNGWTDYLGHRRFDQIESRLTTLGVGLLLHDIGKTAIPHAILNKPGRLTDPEMDVMRTHVRAGVDLLSDSRWDPLVKAIVLRHHERWNGSGYPSGQIRTEIHELARIAAVADVYDAITSARPYAAARPAVAGVKAILGGAGTLFDPEIVKCFAQVIAPYPAGTEVRLSDGHEAIVVSAPENHFDRPVVRMIEDGQAVGELALFEHPELSIVDDN